MRSTTRLEKPIQDRWARRLLAVVAIAVLVAGSLAMLRPRPSTEIDAFLRLMEPQGAGAIYGYDTLEEQADAADVVVLGRIVDIVPSEVTYSDGSGTSTAFLDVRVRVDEVLRGELTDNTDVITIEMFKEPSVSLEEIRATLPRGIAGVHFLFDGGELAARQGAPAEQVARQSGTYVHVNDDQGFYLEDPDTGRPVGFETLDRDPEELPPLIAPYATFTDLVEAMRSSP